MSNFILLKPLGERIEQGHLIQLSKWIKRNSNKFGVLNECSALRDSKILGTKKLDQSYDVFELSKRYGAIQYLYDEYNFGYSFGKNEFKNHNYSLRFENDRIHWPAEDLISLCKELYFLTAQCKYGYVYTYGDDADKLYDEGTGQFPNNFVSLALNWYNIVHPEYYPDFISKEDLLKTPAYKVEELEDGHIALQIFKEPYDYFSDESMEYIRACTKYLFKVIADMDI